MVRWTWAAGPRGSARQASAAPRPSAPAWARRGQVHDTDVAHEHARLETGSDSLGEGLLGGGEIAWQRSAARVKGRRSALARSTSVKTRARNRSPKRSSEFWIRSMEQRSGGGGGVLLWGGGGGLGVGGGGGGGGVGGGGGGFGCVGYFWGLIYWGLLRELPVPTITAPHPSARACAAPPASRPVEDRLADQEMADVELQRAAGSRRSGRHCHRSRPWPACGSMPAPWPASAAASAMRRSSSARARASASSQ